MCFFFQNAAENLWCCWAASTMQEELARQRGNGKILESATLKKYTFIMTPKWLKYGMLANLPWDGPKNKSAKYGLESWIDEVRVIKQSGGECLEDQYWFQN